MKKKGFTLIELLAVIVILAIIALIVTPVITGIIRSARDAADKRSAEAYVKAGENFFTSTLLSVENYALLGTNVIDKLDVSHNPATGSVIVDGEGNVEMAIVIRDKCYRKAKTASIGEITVDEDVDNCTLGAVITYTPERCFEYELDTNNNATITNYLCGSTGDKYGYVYIHNNDGEFNDVYIPPTLSGYNVIAIGESAFEHRFIDSVVIPEGVTEIRTYAFAHNTLNNVTFPSTLVSIGEYAFNTNYLRKIVISDSVTSIGTAAFESNELTSVTISDSVKSIGKNAFAENNISKLSLGNGVETIGSYAFPWTDLMIITIPNSVVSIGYNAFRSDSKALNIRVDNTIGAIEGESWGAYWATITYLRGVNVDIDPSLADLSVIEGSEIEFVSLDPFKKVTSVTINGTVQSGNTFTAPTDSTRWKVTAYTYEELESITIETPHPYPNNANDNNRGIDFWYFFDKTTKSYTITFDEASKIETRDSLYVSGSSNEEYYYFDGTEMAGQTYTISGTTLDIQFSSNASINYYGFKATITKNK